MTPINISVPCQTSSNSSPMLNKKTFNKAVLVEDSKDRENNENELNFVMQRETNKVQPILLIHENSSGLFRMKTNDQCTTPEPMIVTSCLFVMTNKDSRNELRR